MEAEDTEEIQEPRLDTDLHGFVEFQKGCLRGRIRGEWLVTWNLKKGHKKLRWPTWGLGV